MRLPRETVERHRWRDFIPAIALLIVSAGGTLVAALAPNADHGQYGIVAPPWYNFSQTAGLIGTAGGDIVDFGGLPNVAIAHSSNPDFVQTLYHAGAWLVIDPLGLRGCLGFDRNPTVTTKGT